MKKSPNNSNNFQQSSTYSTYSTASHSHPHPHPHNHTNQAHESQQVSGIASMLSPRNIMKFFSRNVEEIMSPRSGMFHGERGDRGDRDRGDEGRFRAKWGVGEIQREFEKYVGGILGEIKKYKANQMRKAERQARNDTKERQRQQLQHQIKMSKIPQQYFQNWQHQPPTSSPSASPSLSPNPQPLHTLLSLSLSLPTPTPKKSPLLQKQLQLQCHLDQIQLIIYNKTCRYPDRYLNYLSNLNDADLEIVGILGRVRMVREGFGVVLGEVRGRMGRIGGLEGKRRRIQGVLGVVRAMKELYRFKKQSQAYKNKDKIDPESSPTKSTSQLMKFIHQHPQLTTLSNLNSTKQTLQNIETLAKKIRSQKLQQICQNLHKTLTTTLSKTYSRESWLKSQLPKNILLITRMKPQIQAELQAYAYGQDGQEKDLNNSYMNISVLDQSYCVGANVGDGDRREFGGVGVGGSNGDFGAIVDDWGSYCGEYWVKGKFQEEDEMISEVLQRVLLKFVLTFKRDLQDYLIFIYTQKHLNPSQFPPTHLLLYLSPKFFTKISQTYFHALSTTFTMSTIFKILPTTCQKLLKTIQQKIMEFIGLRCLGDYAVVQGGIVGYEDVVDVLGGLDYWLGYIGNMADIGGIGGIGGIDGDGDGDGVGIQEMMMGFEEELVNKKNAIVEEYLANSHKFALISDLKSAIQKQDFTSISIPISSFTLLDSIINWGQSSSSPQTPNLKSNNEIEQSFNYGTSISISILTQMNPYTMADKKVHSFSIFKVIDKKLVIEGKEYWICGSFMMLCGYLGVCLKAKREFLGLGTNIDQRICELIGFYIWYCKKIIFTSSQPHQSQPTHLPKSPPQKHPNQPHPTQSPKKTLPNLCMLANICDLLTKFLDILNITTKPKKLDKILQDLKLIKQDSMKEMTVIPFLQIQRQIGLLYESRLKTRKEVPTKESGRIVEILGQARKDLEMFCQGAVVRRILENSVKVICKNFFGYLGSMEVRGKAELKWFFPKFKDIVGDLFPDEISNLEKLMRY